MSERRERIAAALEGVRSRMEEKDARIAALTSARDALQAFIDTPDWGELSSGASIQAGDVVRFGALRYRARSNHNKALTRSPINLIYWEPTL